MATETKRVEVTLETLLESVDLAESIVIRIAEALGFSEEDCHKIGMSVREAVINAYNYGNQKDRDRKVFLKVELEDEKRMIIRILDEGTGFDPQEVPDPLADENLLRTSGRGLFLMKAFMDEFTVRRGTNGGAEVVMTKNLPAKPSAGTNSRSGRKKDEEK